MGMFDTIRCKVGLPGSPIVDEWQTKDFPNPRLRQFTITEDGKLLDSANRIVDVTGDINFYSTTTNTGRWVEYYAPFRHGHLSGRIIKVEEDEDMQWSNYQDPVFCGKEWL